ncbi:hypothetical protein MDAP_001791 [Mitosporidium daphniae]|uniref:Transmembrane protein n=1 Tax=Mitosporidium daphniae TaxID=1485682 RepID=A0A098VTD9_9MICR|nr:uncharacterized protein DI09_19p170 [Mitosporidium daphniae]KGG52235.1 hypothetical protein DI09_19p170 [Mitosporidium daphniae]|eukprot:XP_013238662.1 uncharacterized protein DI09_19p170 [Mitosporidium daphniae]
MQKKAKVLLALVGGAIFVLGVALIFISSYTSKYSKSPSTVDISVVNDEPERGHLETNSTILLRNSPLVPSAILNENSSNSNDIQNAKSMHLSDILFSIFLIGLATFLLWYPSYLSQDMPSKLDFHNACGIYSRHISPISFFGIHVVDLFGIAVMFVLIVGFFLWIFGVDPYIFIQIPEYVKKIVLDCIWFPVLSFLEGCHNGILAIFNAKTLSGVMENIIAYIRSTVFWEKLSSMANYYFDDVLQKIINFLMGMARSSSKAA